jgi:hypothetical protein
LRAGLPAAPGRLQREDVVLRPIHEVVLPIVLSLTVDFPSRFGNAIGEPSKRARQFAFYGDSLKQFDAVFSPGPTADGDDPNALEFAPDDASPRVKGLPDQIAVHDSSPAVERVGGHSVLAWTVDRWSVGIPIERRIIFPPTSNLPYTQLTCRNLPPNSPVPGVSLHEFPFVLFAFPLYCLNA